MHELWDYRMTPICSPGFFEKVILALFLLDKKTDVGCVPKLARMMKLL